MIIRYKKSRDNMPHSLFPAPDRSRQDKSGEKSPNRELFSDQLGYFKLQIGKNKAGITVHGDVLVCSLEEFG